LKGVYVQLGYGLVGMVSWLSAFGFPRG